LNEKQLKLFIRQAFSLENIAENALMKADPEFLRTMALVRRKVLELPDVTLLRDSEWRRLLGEIEIILQRSNDAFAKSLIDELRINYPKMREQAEKMVSSIPSVNIFAGTAGEIKGMPTIAGLQTVELQNSVREAINNTKVNNTRLIDLFGLQDVDELKPAVMRDTMAPWIKQKIKIIDRTVRAGILQGAETKRIAKEIGDEIKADIRFGRRMFEGSDATRRIKAQARAIARTAVQDMNRQVNEQVWNENNFSSDLRWEWVAAFDSRTCPVCAPLDNLVRKKRESFPEYPIHVNCRCQIVLIDPEDTDPRAGIDVSPEKDGFNKKAGRKYKSKVNVKGEQLFRKAFDVKGENPGYADFLSQSDIKTQGMFFGGGNAGSIRADRFRTFIKGGLPPREAMQKLITNAPRPNQTLKKIDITKVRFKKADEE
tara:strand:- start:1683 stop:2966 length:1284 start_codon:yes stop_codon:yes gene_type:complete